MGQIFYLDWEVSLIEWLQRTMGAAGEGAAKVLSFLGGETCMLLVLLCVLFCYKKEVGLRCGISILAAGMWFPMLKNIVLRYRPYMAHPERVSALMLAEPDAGAMDVIQQGFSFPSGHAATTVAIYGGLAREIRKKWMWVLAAVLSLLIGISRFAVGVHYPTDVLAGWAVGILAVCFAAFLEKKVPNLQARYVILLVISLPGILWCGSRDYYASLGLLAGMVAGLPAERRFARFRDTRNVFAMVLRVVGAFGLYYVLNVLLKLPFSKAFLDSGTLGANLIRTLRYAVILFMVIGVYPRVFPLYERIGKKRA